MTEAEKDQAAKSLFWMAKGAWLWELGRQRIGLDYVAQRLGRPEAEIKHLAEVAEMWSLNDISDLYVAIGAEPVFQVTSVTSKKGATSTAHVDEPAPDTENDDD